MLASWNILTTEEQLDKAIALSEEKPVVLFKHSIRCGTSLHAKHKLESEWSNLKDEIEFYYLDLLQYRNISNKIAHELNVIHQSPQIILVKNGRVVFSASHQAVSVDAINKAL